MFDFTSLISDANLDEGLSHRPHDLPREGHGSIVQRVCGLFQAAKRDQSDAAELYQVRGEWESYVGERQSLYKSLLDDEVDQALSMLQAFWRNELGPIVKEYATYEQLTACEAESVERFSNGVVRNYLVWREIFHESPDVLSVPPVGDPWGYMIEDQLVVPKATRYHAHAHKVAELVGDSDRPVVGELGAGYGGTAYYLLRDNPRITYVDFDIPETLALAAYYLLCCFPESDIYLYGEAPIPVDPGSQQYRALLLPNYALPQMNDRSINLFLNAFSLSEMPFSVLEEYVLQIQRIVS